MPFSTIAQRIWRRDDTLWGEAGAREVADLGYVVLVPNFYYRHGEVAPFDQPSRLMRSFWVQS